MQMIKETEIIKNLIGDKVTKEDLAFVDCYMRPQLGIFIPAAGPCGYAARPNHSHPSYMVCISFGEREERMSHYAAEIVSPGVPHNDKDGQHYYCILIEKEYFESRYAMYEKALPVYNGYSFLVCIDILKALNTFMFEYSKSMKNAEITLDAQAEIITHWLIRSILGENFDMRRVSSDYSVARAQHYMEQHYMNRITVSQLAALGYVSISCFSRRFKKETDMTPMEYLIDVRLNRAKILLRRKQISVTEISMRCGFNSSTHFSACFQNKLGLSPSEYREKYVN